MSWQIDGKQWKQWQTLFSWAPKLLQMVTAAMKLKDACSLGKKKKKNPRQDIIKNRHYFVTKVHLRKSYDFPSSHTMPVTAYKEGWAPKNWCVWTVVLKTLESPLDSKEIQPVHPKGDQSWVFIGMTDAKAEAESSIFWPPDVKNWLIGKRLWCWELLKVRGEGDNRGRDGWVASLTLWTWVWASYRSWWWTAKLGMLHFMVSQRVGHN